MYERHTFLMVSLTIVVVLQTRCILAESSDVDRSHESWGFVAVGDRQFLDGAKKPLLLHGINIINKSKLEGYTKGIEQADFRTIRGWGMNCVRFGIFWDGLEPRPGEIDEAYLDRIDQIVGWAKQAGLYVLLDMHQDLYSVKFSDGAPAWATLDEGKPYTPTSVWSDAYYTSEGVQTALDHFWANSPGPDGVGLQDHYARVWRRVAERFRREPAVLGYDLMNEPFPGKDNARNRLVMFAKLIELLPGRLRDKSPTIDQLVKLLHSPEGRQQIAKWLEDPDLYSGVLQAGAPLMQAFERERLMPMFRRVRRSIRAVDADHVIFLEPATSANIGIASAVSPLIDERGCRDIAQAYAPHAYDLVTDTPQAGTRSSNHRIERIFERHAEKGRELNMPVLLGEWGAYYEDPSAVGAARFVRQQIEKFRFGDIYWAYRRTLGESPLRQVLSGPSSDVRP